MKIEVLYPELCCLYGDKANMRYLQLCLPEATFVYTSLNDRPVFLDEEVKLCYMGSMSEQSQERILQRLIPYKELIKERCESKKVFFLLTGNAMELFGKFIECEDGRRIEGLAVLDSHALRHVSSRTNSLIQAQFKDITLIGYTSRFSDTYGISESQAFCQVKTGIGMNGDTKMEGVLNHNMIGTYLLGPLLIANPDFTHWLLHYLNISEVHLPYEKEVREAYEKKCREFQKPDLVLE